MNYMMMQIKKYRYFIISIIILLITVVGYIIFFSKKSVEVPFTVLPSPSITNYFKDSLPISLTVKKTNFNFPNKVALLEKKSQSAFGETEMTAIAANLGFEDTPQKGNDIQKGLLYIWNNKNNFLTIYPKQRKIKFGPSTDPLLLINKAIDKQLTEKEITTTAENFLIDKIGLKKESLKLTNYFYLKRDKTSEIFKETDKNDYQLIQINFVFSSAQYPILTLNPLDTVLYVQISKDGSIVNAEINLTNDFVLGLTEYKILDYNEFSASIGKAVLVSVDDGNLNLPDIDQDQIKQITINEVQLVYLLDNYQNQYLQPVFLLKGKAVVQGYTKDLKVSFYLPALSKPN